MQCFEVTERVSEGLRVHYPDLVMGYGPGEVRLPMWGGARAWLQRHLDEPARMGEQFLFTQADVRSESGTLWLTTADPEDRALLLVRTTTVEGGRIEFRHNKQVRTLLEARYESTPERLVTMLPGGLLRIKRDGVEPEDGLPGKELILGWDGRTMHALHESAWR